MKNSWIDKFGVYKVNNKKYHAIISIKDNNTYVLYAVDAKGDFVVGTEILLPVKEIINITDQAVLKYRDQLIEKLKQLK